MANELRQLVDNANAPIFGIDNDGNVNEWNEMTAEITGFSTEFALGKALGRSTISNISVHSIHSFIQYRS
jgi:PAS domain S-box-containing protein